MKATLLTLNKPNLNGRTYTTEVIQKAIQRHVDSGKPLLVRGSFDENVRSLENVIGEVKNIEVSGDCLIGEIKLFPGKEPLYSLSCRPAFVGKTNESGRIDMDSLELISFAMTNDPA